SRPHRKGVRSVFEPFTEGRGEVVGKHPVLGRSSETETMTDAVLDDRGAEAWELASVVPRPDGARLIFKRRRS
ncbi:MAG: hypothetical protein M3265_01870, partial [Actinomycetota bacterium]|nr:hypothetical protein [Actinomycetota bacterium]